MAKIKKEPLGDIVNGNFAKELSITSGKMPPNAVDFEKLIIGTLLVDRKAIDILIEVLGTSGKCFYDPRFVLIYEAATSMHKRQIPIDMMTIIQELKRLEKLNLAGGDHFIIDLTMGVSSSAHLEYHARIVYEKFILRSLINKSANTIDYSYRESTDVFELLDANRKALDEIFDDLNQSQQSVEATKVHMAVVSNIGKKEKSGNKIPIHYKDLASEMTIEDGNFIVIAARSGVGKSTLAMNFATTTALGGIPSAYISLEMSADELHKRAISNICNVSFYRLVNDKLREDEMTNIFSNSVIEKMPLYYDESTELFTICSKIRKLHKKGVRYFIIDYLQIVGVNLGKGSTREQEVAFITRTFKQLARELRVVIFGLAQLLRDIDKRAIKRPTLADLRESSAIEADADIVMLLYRPEIYKVTEWDREWDGVPNLPTKGELEINVAKYRNGQPFEVRVKFWGDFQRIMNITDEAQYYNPVPFSTSSQDKVVDDNNFWYED